MKVKVSRNLSAPVLLCATLFTLAVLALGYLLLGLVPMFLFGFGYLGGLLIWIFVPSDVSFRAIRAPYMLVLALFVAHKLEERYLDFFPALSQLTGESIPQSVNFLGALLYAFAGAWLLIPWLMKCSHEFGYFLAWTFFAAMGITELAHFVFPLFTDKPYSYFPGMASVVALAPAAWWGMWRMRVKGQ